MQLKKGQKPGTNKINRERGYKLTFFLTVLLILAAFATKQFDKKNGDLKTDTGSWFLLLGGLVMLVYGLLNIIKRRQTNKPFRGYE